MADSHPVEQSAYERLLAMSQILINTDGIIGRCMECRRPILLVGQAPARCRPCKARSIMIDPGGCPDPIPY